MSVLGEAAGLIAASSELVPARSQMVITLVANYRAIRHNDEEACGTRTPDRSSTA